MSFVITLPEQLAAAAGTARGNWLSHQRRQFDRGVSYHRVIPAAADEVSAVTASFFASYGQLYQAISAEASMIHQQFVNALGLSANSYAATEAANMMSAGTIRPRRSQPQFPEQRPR